MRQGRAASEDEAEEAEGEPGKDGQTSPGWGRNGRLDDKGPDWMLSFLDRLCNSCKIGVCHEDPLPNSSLINEASKKNRREAFFKCHSYWES